jgi:hypothetical protein
MQNPSTARLDLLETSSAVRGTLSDTLFDFLLEAKILK